MNAQPLRTAALVTHLFVPTSGEQAEQERERLLTLWDGVVSTEALDVLRDPRSGDPAAPGTIGFAERRTDGTRQAMIRVAHDVLVLSVLLEPAEPDANGWPALDERWSRLLGPAAPPGLGAVRVYHGLLRTDADDPRAVADLVADAVPGATGGPNWRGRGVLTGDGVMLWEPGSTSDERAERRLLVLAGPDHEGALSAWLWTGSARSTALTPFTRYLLHAAKLRHQLRVWSSSSADVERARRQVDATTSEVLAALAATAELSQDAVDRLLGKCVRLEQMLTNLNRTGAQVRTVRRTSEIAISNRTAALGPQLAASGGLFADDAAVGTWLTAVLDDEIHYLETVRDSARDVVVAVRVATERRAAQLQRQQADLQEAREKSRAEQRESFSLLQAALIGALAVLLSAVQSLEYHPPIDERLHPAIIALISAVALALGLGLLRKHELDRRDPSVRRWAARPVMCISVGLAAAATGWLGETAVRVLGATDPAGIDPAVMSSTLVAVVTGTAGALVTWAVTRRGPEASAEE